MGGAVGGGREARARTEMPAVGAVRDAVENTSSRVENTSSRVELYWKKCPMTAPENLYGFCGPPRDRLGVKTRGCVDDEE